MGLNRLYAPFGNINAWTKVQMVPQRPEVTTFAATAWAAFAPTKKNRSKPQFPGQTIWEKSPLAV